ncbi:MAG: sugar phosphate isomerase/epimerase, partial [Firmicutes bacterium]|nr:sugar phosphate isomerase/epimerase [Bacillota bacterium]
EGIGFAVETHQGQLADTTRSTLRLVLQVDEENFGVNLDIHNLFAVGEDPVSALRLLAPYVVHVHAKNADETSRKYGVPLAKGNMDYAPFLQELSEIGYGGYVSIEWFGEGAVENAASELAFLRKFQVLVG